MTNDLFQVGIDRDTQQGDESLIYHLCDLITCDHMWFIWRINNVGRGSHVWRFRAPESINDSNTPPKGHRWVQLETSRYEVVWTGLLVKVSSWFSQSYLLMSRMVFDFLVLNTFLDVVVANIHVLGSRRGDSIVGHNDGSSGVCMNRGRFCCEK